MIAFALSWPPALVLSIILLASQLLEGRYRFFSSTTWIALVLIGTLLLVAIVVAENRFRADRATLVATVLVAYATALDIWGLHHLVALLVSGGPGVHGAQLLVSSVYFWGCNVLTFSLWYWLIDRGGPYLRAHRAGGRAEFLFPEMTAGDIVDPQWRPGLGEYMYLALTNATAFSPTDTLPLSARARALMALESMMSLVTVAFVAARAVNILS